MSDLCPQCGRVAQKSRPTCLYCGAPLDGSTSTGAVPETPPERGAERPAEVEAPESQEAPEASLPPARPAPAAPPPRAALAARSESPRSVLRSGTLWLVIVLGAVIVGALVAGRSGEEEQPAPAPTTTEEALALAAEGLMTETEAPPGALAPALAETRTSRARGSMSLVSQWIEAYASEYGHYPAALGVGLDALAQFSEGADMEWVLAPFEGQRVDYSRSVAAGGEEESYVLSGTVVGTDRQVTARGSRRRGGDPRNPAPLPSAAP